MSLCDIQQKGDKNHISMIFVTLQSDCPEILIFLAFVSVLFMLNGWLRVLSIPVEDSDSRQSSRQNGMKTNRHCKLITPVFVVLWALGTLCVSFLCTPLNAAEEVNPSTSVTGSPEESPEIAPKSEPVDIFDAMDQGIVDVKFIAKSSSKGRLVFTNKT